MSSGIQIVDELDGLVQNVTEATLGVITRTPTVLGYAYDGVFPGTGQGYPLIQIAPYDWRIDRLQAGGGRIGRKGQNLNAPSLYILSIEDAINPRDTTAGRVAASQRDIYALIDAIVRWFDVVSHRCLPVVGDNRATLAGEHIRFRIPTPYKESETGAVRVAAPGVISVVGLPHDGIDA